MRQTATATLAPLLVLLPVLLLLEVVVHRGVDCAAAVVDAHDAAADGGGRPGKSSVLGRQKEGNGPLDLRAKKISLCFTKFSQDTN